MWDDSTVEVVVSSVFAEVVTLAAVFAFEEVVGSVVHVVLYRTPRRWWVKG